MSANVALIEKHNRALRNQLIRIGSTTLKNIAILSVYTLILSLTYVGAICLRFELTNTVELQQLLSSTLVWVLLTKLAVFYAFGCLQYHFCLVSFRDLIAILQAATVAELLVLATDAWFPLDESVPRVVLLLDWGGTILVFGAVRSLPRIMHELVFPLVRAKPKQPVLIVGANKGGEGLVRLLQLQPELNYRVVGFLDTDVAARGFRLSGVPLLGGPADTVTIARKRQVTRLFVITGSLSGHELRHLLAECCEAGIKVKMIPPVGKLLDGSYQLRVRDVDINDLLHREPIQLDTKAIGNMISGRRVMVTGAGGSIGAEICRQVIKHHPQRLILVERAENSLFQIDQELKRDYVSERCYACLADACDEQRMETLFQQHEPHVVFHAAAHKHVPLMEINAGEAVKNNIFGTAHLANLSDKYDVDRFILISTDKAVNPTSVMGLSKKFCERYVYSMQDISATKFVVVRFGNVLGSNGSVIPTFQEQIRRGGPVTVTHAEMRRYFMTIPEASQLVLQAAVLGQGGEIFVLDMGEPIKIVDLAHDLIRLSGCEEGEIETTIVGLRPGEKLTEEIFDAVERTCPTPHLKLRAVYPQAVDRVHVLRCLDELRLIVNDPEAIVREKLYEFTDSKKPQGDEPACYNKPHSIATLGETRG